MTTITISLSDDRLQKIKQLAVEAGISPEEFLQATVEDWLSSLSDDFSQASNYVLAKNAALYERLA